MKFASAFTIIILASAAIKVSAVNPYPELQEKADLFFNHKQWASAAAIYDLMLDERPTIPSSYGLGIVANGMIGNRPAQTALMAKAIENHVPFDSVFTQVRQWSYHIGKPLLYEDFLKINREEYTWMRRALNRGLLQYFSFRRNAPEMVAYADTMLLGAPENIDFLNAKAKGYMLQGNFDRGIAIYSQILNINPDHYPTLLELGNWFANQPSDAERETSLELLRHAYFLKPTPYVARSIRQLETNLHSTH